MSVHQTKDGRWFVFYHKGFNRDDPGRTREYFGRGIGAELAAHERNHALGLGKQRPGESVEPSFALLSEEYMLGHGAQMARTSREDTAYKLEGVILPEIGHLPASKVGPAVLDTYIKTRIDAGKKKTTIHRELSIIRAILRWGMSRRKIVTNPMDGYQLPT
ncbi:MAG: hypothetical protein FWG62_10150 [Proteobacteria bacterium]|nr:hypothetical protein [Pseudomonadota bacterium]